MKVAIIGGSGFIGGYFLQEYSNQFDEIRCLVRNRKEILGNNIVQYEGSLKDKEIISQVTLGVDAVVHAGFDPLYRENTIGLRNLLECMIENKITKLVNLSSYVVYDVFHSPYLNESNPLSKLNDIYTKEKQELEKILSNFSQNNPAIRIINLQPTIVYGLGGSWTNSLLISAKHSYVKIPNLGNYLSPIIYVKDVTKAIFNCLILSTENQEGLESVILNSVEVKKWLELYEIHGAFLNLIGKENYTQAYIEGYQGRFGNIWITNWILSIIFSGFLSKIFKFLLVLAKRKLYKKELLDKIINYDKIDKCYELIGLYKYLQSYDSKVDCLKSRNFINFTPRFSLSEGLDDMINIYKTNGRQK